MTSFGKKSYLRRSSFPVRPKVGNVSILFLSPANDVWSKVIFSEACVIPFTGGSLYDITSVWLPDPIFLLGGSLSRGVSVQGVSVRGVSVWRVSVWGISVQGVSVQGGWGGLYRETPSSTVDEQVVYILLECYLVVLLKFENKLDTVGGQIKFYSKQYDKCKSAFQFILLVLLFNLYPLEVVQKCQRSQLCALRENSDEQIELMPICLRPARIVRYC